MESASVIVSLLILHCAIYDVNARATNRVARATTADNPCGVLVGDGPATSELYNNTVDNIYQTAHEITDLSESIKNLVKDEYKLQSSIIELDLDQKTFLTVDPTPDQSTLDDYKEKPVKSLSDTYLLAYTLLVHVDSTMAEDTEIGSGIGDTEMEVKGELTKLRDSLYRLMCHVKIGLLAQNVESPVLESPDSMIRDGFNSWDNGTLFIEICRAYILMNDAINTGTRIKTVYSAIDQSLS